MSRCEHLRLLAIDEGAVRLGQGKAGQLLRAVALRRFPAGERDAALAQRLAAVDQAPARQLRLAAQRGAALDLEAQRGGAPPDFGQGGGEQRADMDRVADRAGLDQGERGRAPGHHLQRRGQPDDRPLAFGEARALRRLKRADQGDAPLGRGEIGLGGLDPRRQRRARRPRAVGVVGRAARLAVERLIAPRRRGRLLLGLGQRRRVAAARRLRRAGRRRGAGRSPRGERCGASP